MVRKAFLAFAAFGGVAVGTGAWVALRQARMPTGYQCPPLAEVVHEVEGARERFMCVLNNLQEGPSVELENGQIVLDVFFQAGKRHGPATERSHEGVLSGRYANDLRTGVWRLTVDGQVRRSNEYRNGKIEGLSVNYYSDGGRETSQEYDAGVAWGRYESWLPGGSKELTGEMHGEQRTGVWTRYAPDNTVIESWVEPRPDAGDIDHSFVDLSAQELFSGRPVSWWRARLAELHAAKDAEAEQLLELTRHRFEQHVRLAKEAERAR